MTEQPTTRIGIFIDGGYHDYVYQELANTPPRHRLSLIGLVGAIERYLSGKAVERHYVRGSHGRNSFRTELVADLEVNDFTIHSMPVNHRKEVGVDVALALLTYTKAAEEHLDAVAVFTGDGDLHPLVQALKRAGVPCLIPKIKLDRQQTSHFLLEAADHTPDLFDLAEDANRTPGAHAVLSRNAPGQAAPILESVSGPTHRGIIKFVDRAHRFAFIEDLAGQTWYMSPQVVPGEPREAKMVAGIEVSFSGAPNPAPGQRYPRAWSIRSAA